MEDLLDWRTVIIVVLAILVAVVAGTSRRMLSKGPLKVNLFLVLGKGHVGPIGLTVYQHHIPAQVISPAMDEPLQIPPAMRTGKPRFLYSLRRRDFLKPAQAYREQRIEDGDVFLLTDIQDIDKVELSLKRWLTRITY